MEPDLEKLLADLRAANETAAQAFIAQTMAFNKLHDHLSHMIEKQPTLFTQDKDH